jgi:hypothetical protein
MEINAVSLTRERKLTVVAYEIANNINSEDKC